ncbi:MAG TPA: hypothetical protein VKA64_02140 [Gammaproteobacteria bacterium]|nr:hypothetical protein [Gammaproteobacteria bacterium]
MSNRAGEIAAACIQKWKASPELQERYDGDLNHYHEDCLRVVDLGIWRPFRAPPENVLEFPAQRTGDTDQ